MSLSLHENIELDWLKRWNTYSPKARALTEGSTGKSSTYSEIYQAALQGADFLKTQFNIQKGDRVLLVAQNEISSIILFFSLQRLGAILVPANFRLTAPELDYICTDCSPKLIVSTEEFHSTLENLSAENQKIPRLLLKGNNSFESFTAASSAKKDLSQEFVGHLEDPVLVLYTSGTTGFPKGAMLSHRTLFWNSISTSLRLNITQKDSALIFLPLFHTGGWNVLTTPFLHRGAEIILLKKFEPDLVLKLSDQHRCTLLFGVPTTMDMMARSKEFKSTDLSSLRYAIVGGEPMSIELIKVWHEKGVLIRQGYGLTEFGPNVFSLNEEDVLRKIGSVGFANFYIDTQVMKEDGTICNDGEIGELCLRGPAMMLGYWNKPDATHEAIREGWLHTGDLVRRDEDGYFYIVGRKKEMFISGGENVYPVEVEKVLYSYPGVVEAAVVGVPDPQWGEVGKAFLALDSGLFSPEQTSQVAEQIRNYLMQNLAKFKVPKYIEIVKELPKNESGKILKRALLK